MKKQLLAIVFICVTSISWSQINEVGVFFGGTNYVGDVGKTNYISPSNIGASFIYKYNLNPRIAFRSTLSFYAISGDDAKSSNIERTKRNFSFKLYFIFINNFNFRIEALDDYVEITWETNAETDILSFEVERAIDTTEFITISQIEPFSSEEGSNYLEVDKELIFNKLLTYRLKVIQKDTFIYSKTFELFIEKPINQIELVNNPTKNKNYIQFSSEFESEAKLAIYNANGLNHTETIKIHPGNNEFEVQIEDETPGVYFLQFDAPRTIWIERILKIGS